MKCVSCDLDNLKREITIAIMLHLLWIRNKNILAIDHHFLKLTGNIINKQFTLLNYKIVSSLNL